MKTYTQQNIAVALCIAIFIAGGTGFYGGMKYQETKIPSFPRQAGMNTFGAGRMGQNQAVRAGVGGRPIAGEVIGSDDVSITIKLQDGSSKIIFVSERTDINKASKGTRTDVQVGENVAVFGQENPDGSIAASSIQLNPVLRMATESAEVK